MSYFYFQPFDAPFPYFTLPQMLFQNMFATTGMASDWKKSLSQTDFCLSAAIPSPEAPLSSSQPYKISNPQENSVKEPPVSEQPKPTLDSVRCLQCNHDFKNIKGLKQHTGRMHKKSPKKSVCKFCAKKFKNQYAVKSHIRQVHDKSTKVECEVCQRMIYNKYELKKHMMREHQE